MIPTPPETPGDHDLKRLRTLYRALGDETRLRVIGLPRSVPVFIGDLVKGAIAASLPLLYSDDPWARAAGGLAAAAPGHAVNLFEVSAVGADGGVPGVAPGQLHAAAVTGVRQH